MKRTADILLIGVLVSGCSNAVAPETRAEAIEAIAARCNLPHGTLTLVGQDELHIQPPIGTKYESMECALKELKRLKFPMKMGFVGNEAFAPEAK